MEQEHINRIKEAREKYKPDEIKCLFIAEAPPSDPNRFFYFEEVWEQDSLYLEMMKVLFPEDAVKFDGIDGQTFKLDFLMGPSTSELRQNKKKYLTRFMNKGYYLIDNLDFPMPPQYSRTKDKIHFLEGQKDRTYAKVKQIIDHKTPIILISVPVFQANAGNLKYFGLNVVHDEPIEFPGSGQQKKFREKMEKLFNEKQK